MPRDFRFPFETETAQQERRDERGYPVGISALSMISLGGIGFTFYKYYPKVRESKFATGVSRILKGLNRLPFISGSLPFETPLPAEPATPLPLINRANRFQEIWGGQKGRFREFYGNLTTAYSTMKRQQLEEIVQDIRRVRQVTMRTTLFAALSKELNERGALNATLDATSKVEDVIQAILRSDIDGDTTRTVRKYVKKALRMDRELGGILDENRAFLAHTLGKDAHSEHGTFKYQVREHELIKSIRELPQEQRDRFTRKVRDIIGWKEETQIARFPLLTRTLSSEGAVDDFFREHFGKALDFKEFKFEDIQRTDALRHLQNVFHIPTAEAFHTRELVKKIQQMRGVDDVRISLVRQGIGGTPSSVLLNVNVRGKMLPVELPLTDQYGVVRSKGMSRLVHRRLGTSGIDIVGPSTLRKAYETAIPRAINAASRGDMNAAKGIISGTFQEHINRLYPFEARLSATFMSSMWHDPGLDQAIGMNQKAVMRQYERQLQHMLRFKNLLSKANEYIVVDIETNTHSALIDKHRPIEIAAKRYVNGRAVDTFHYIMDPTEFWKDWRDMPETMRKPTEGFAHISRDEFTKRRNKAKLQLPHVPGKTNYGSTHKAFAELSEWLGRQPERVPMLGHNILDFDIPIMKRVAKSLGINIEKRFSERTHIDTLQVSRAMFRKGEVTDHKLETLFRNLLMREQTQSHLAIHDIDDNMEVVKYFRRYMLAHEENIAANIDLLKEGKRGEYISFEDKMTAMDEHIKKMAPREFAGLVNRTLLSSTQASRGKFLPIGIEHLTPFGFGMGFYAEMDSKSGKVAPQGKIGLPFRVAGALHAEFNAAFMTPSSAEELQKFYPRSFEPYFMTKDMLEIQKKTAEMRKFDPSVHTKVGQMIPQANVMFTDSASVHEGVVLVKESYARRFTVTVDQPIRIKAQDLAGAIENRGGTPRLNVSKFLGKAPGGRSGKHFGDIIRELDRKLGNMTERFGIDTSRVVVDVGELAAGGEAPRITLKPGESVVKNPATPTTGKWTGAHTGRITSVELIGSQDGTFQRAVELKINVAMEVPMVHGFKIGGPFKSTVFITPDEVIDSIVGNKSLDVQMVASASSLQKHPGYFFDASIKYARDALERKLAAGEINRYQYDDKLKKLLKIVTVGANRSPVYHQVDHVPGGKTAVYQGLPRTIGELEKISSSFVIPGVFGSDEIKLVMDEISDLVGVRKEEMLRGAYPYFLGRIAVTSPANPTVSQLYKYSTFGDFQNVLTRGATLNPDALDAMWEMVAVDRSATAHLGMTEKQTTALRSRLKPAVRDIKTYLLASQEKAMKEHGISAAFRKIGWIINNIHSIPGDVPVMRLIGDQWQLLERSEHKLTGKILQVIMKDSYDEFGNAITKPGATSSIEKLMKVESDFLLQLPGGATMEVNDPRIRQMVKRSIPQDLPGIFVPGARDTVLRKTKEIGLVENEWGRLVPKEAAPERHINRSIRDLFTYVERGQTEKMQQGADDLAYTAAAAISRGKYGLLATMLGAKVTGSLQGVIMPTVNHFLMEGQKRGLGWSPQQDIIEKLKLEPGTVRISKQQLLDMVTGETMKDKLRVGYDENRRKGMDTKRAFREAKKAFMKDIEKVIEDMGGRLSGAKGAKSGVIGEFFAVFQRHPLYSPAVGVKVVKAQVMNNKGPWLSRAMHDHIIQIDHILADMVKGDFDMDIAQMFMVPKESQANLRQAYEAARGVGGSYYVAAMQYSEQMPMFGRYKAVAVQELAEPFDAVVFQERRGRLVRTGKKKVQFVAPHPTHKGIKWFVAHRDRELRTHNTEVDAYIRSKDMVDKTTMERYISQAKGMKHIGMGLAHREAQWVERMESLRGVGLKIRDYMSIMLREQLGRGAEKLAIPDSYINYRKLIGAIERRAGPDVAADMAKKFGVMVQDVISFKHDFRVRLPGEMREALRRVNTSEFAEKFLTGRWETLAETQLDLHRDMRFAGQEKIALDDEIARKAREVTFSRDHVKVLQQVVKEEPNIFASSPAWRLAHGDRNMTFRDEVLHTGRSGMADAQALMAAADRHLAGHGRFASGIGMVDAAHFAADEAGAYYQSPTRKLLSPQLPREAFTESLARTGGEGFAGMARGVGKTALILGGIYAMLNVFNPNQMGRLGYMPGEGGEKYDTTFTEDQLPRQIPLGTPMYTWKSPARIVMEKPGAFERRLRAERTIYSPMGIPVTTPQMARTPGVNMRYYSGRIRDPQLREFINTAVIGAV
jgi:DNA polymerase III epsilon subunit-like protein